MVNADAQTRTADPLARPTGAQPSALTVAPRPTTTTPGATSPNPLHRVVAVLHKPPCVKSKAVDAGREGCTRGPSGDYLAVNLLLPENPAEVRHITVTPGGVPICSVFVNNDLVHCYSETTTKDAP